MASRFGHAYRSALAGFVYDAVGTGGLNLVDAYGHYRDLTNRPNQFAVTSSYMLAKVLHDDYYKNMNELLLALADVRKSQVRVSMPISFRSTQRT